MLQDRMTVESLAGSLISLDEFRPFPRASDRGPWEELKRSELNARRAAYLTGVAEELILQPWPLLPASLFAEYMRTGNRSNYEEKYFRRRQNLAALVLAECMEYKGRCLDAIIDGLLCILEETTWSIPGHTLRREGDILQREDAETVGLFSCETAAVLAEALYLLADELEALSPTLVIRIRRAVIDRIIAPVEEDIERYWWSAGENNWTPWCASNILGAAAYVLDDRTRLARLIHERLNPVVERFLEKYPKDGCCDEGPIYWGVSPGALLIYLEHLHALTAGEVIIYDEPLIHRMGGFITRAHLAGAWALNFADASARMKVRRAPVYRYGERIGSEPMKSLVHCAMRNWSEEGDVSPVLGRRITGGDLCFMLRELFWIPTDEPVGSLAKEKTVWYPLTQVLIARESKVASEGFILAAKGGHNAENHNHNDVGHFVLFRDGEPMIVDIGVGAYTAQTFGPRRYDIFCIRASAHNAPVVGGIEQRAGREFSASNVEFVEDSESRTLLLELAEAYPKEAGLTSLRRRLRLDEDGVALTDTFALKGKKAVELNFYTPTAVEEGDGSLLLWRGNTAVRISWDPKAFDSVGVEEVALEDKRLQEAWGASIRRLIFKATMGDERNSYSLSFTKLE